MSDRDHFCELPAGLGNDQSVNRGKWGYYSFITPYRKLPFINAGLRNLREGF